MRTLPVLLALLIATFALATSAHALPLPPVGAPVLPHAAAADAEEDEAEAEEDEGESEGEEGDEAEACEPEEGEEGEVELCEDEAEEECVLESASAAVTSHGSGRVQITVHYRTYSPSTVNLDYSLHGGKGGLHLGSARAQFHRAGVFHDALTVAGKKLTKLEAARQFVVTMQAAGTPGYCEERLTVQARHRASRRHRAGGRGRSGGPARTRGS